MAGVNAADAIGRLADRETGCLAAVFLTYTFDASFFEEEILASVLPLQEDPVEAPRQFLEEGRRKLIETPVIVIADPGMLRGGQRLPYELLRADPSRVFHPKLALLIFPERARLVVGSGNLTPGGYGGNAELSVALSLHYESDAPLLREVVGFIESCGARGECWKRLLAELNPRLPASPGVAAGPPWFVHTYTNEPLIDALLARLPAGAMIERIGVLAPYHQEDSATPDNALFDRLLQATEGRRAKGFTLDIGVSWEGNSVGASIGQPAVVDLAGHIGKLWAIVDGVPGKEATNWFVLGKHVGHNFKVDDGRSSGSKRSTRELNARCADKTAWPVRHVEAFAPEGLIARVEERANVRLWLHPQVHRRDGRVYVQPLHGKLIAIAVREGKIRKTWLLLGSPNASAMALLRGDGNVECALVLVVDGHLHLGQLCERLVPVPRDQVSLKGREFVVLPKSPGIWIVDAVHDAEAKTLVLTCRPGSPRLTIIYPAPVARPLLDGTPDETLTFDSFALDASCCEIEVRDPAASTSARVPIRVLNIVQLPVDGITGDLRLDDLLLLHSGRYSAAGIAARRSSSGTGDSAADGGVFGGDFSPREIFRAFLSIGSELAAASSLGEFQRLLSGSLGIRKLSERLVEAPDNGELTSIEAWIYAQELSQVLANLTFEGDPTGPVRVALRDEIVRWIQEHLREPAVSIPGMDDLRHFYRRTS